MVGKYRQQAGAVLMRRQERRVDRELALRRGEARVRGESSEEIRVRAGVGVGVGEQEEWYCV